MKMRKITTVLLLALLLVSLGACGKETQVPPALEFQGIPWNSTPEEVFEKLGLDLDSLERLDEEDSMSSEAFTILVPEWKVFGETSMSAQFRFVNFLPEDSSHFGFTGVLIFYPEDCDKEAILASLEKQYGPDAQEYSLYSALSGQAVEHKYTKEPGHSRWFSQQLLRDVLTDSGKQGYRQLLGEISDESFDAILTTPVARISWVEDYYGQLGNLELAQSAIEKYGRVASLSFYGDAMAIMEQRFGTK